MQTKGKTGAALGSTSTAQGNFYRPELDVLRFVAFLLVFLRHTFPNIKTVKADSAVGNLAVIFGDFASACGFGLTLFFTLSAFLICELLTREREMTGTVAVSQFYIRRILRIWPLYYLALGLGSIVAFVPGEDPANFVRIGWFAMFLGAWNCAIHGWLYNPAGPLWSISVEEQFYLFAPWAARYLRRKGLVIFSLLTVLLSITWLACRASQKPAGSSLWADSFV